MKLVTAAEMKAIESQSEEAGVTTGELMLNAGTSVYAAIVAEERFDPENTANELIEGLAVILAGSGNNGGDAMVTAALLSNAFPDAEIKIYFYKRPRPDDPKGFPLKLTYTEAEEQEGQDLSDPVAFQALESDLAEAALVVDGLLGAGLSRAVGGGLDHLIEMVNSAREERRYEPNPLYVVAIDVPSGLSADTGEVLGMAIQADLTVSLGLPKRGLFAYSATDYTGKVMLGNIGLPPEVMDEVAYSVDEEKAPALLTADWVRRHLSLRPLTGHKGTFGKLMVLSGAKEYLGAPYLCTSAAMRSGAGLVTLAAPQSAINVLATKLSENTFLVLPEVESEEMARQAAESLAQRIKAGGYAALLLGPGLGNDSYKLAMLKHFVEMPDFEYPPMVLDADGLNLLAQISDWQTKLPSGNILTPHPGELATLRNSTIKEIEQDRFKAALDAAKAFKQVVILKGAYTVVAAPDGRVRLNPGANPAMGTAGSGDVLAGIAAGLLTQFARQAEKEQLDSFVVACLAVYLHSMTGELVSRDYGDTGVLAGDFLQTIPQAIRAIKQGDSIE